MLHFHIGTEDMEKTRRFLDVKTDSKYRRILDDRG